MADTQDEGGKGKVQGNSQGLESREEKWEQQEQNGSDGK